MQDAGAREAYWRAAITSGTVPPATAFLGFELIDLDAETGWVEAAFFGRTEMLNPGGNLQGGMICAMLDEVMSLAACIIQPQPGMAPTLQMTTSFLRPAPAGRLVARGETLRAGRSTIHTQGWLRAPDGTLLAQAVAACVPKPMAGAYGTAPATRPTES